MHTLQNGLVSAGAVAGAILSLSINAMAERRRRDRARTHPAADRAGAIFTGRFGRIKQIMLRAGEDKN